MKTRKRGARRSDEKRVIAFESDVPSSRAWRERGLSRGEYNRLREGVIENRDAAIRQMLDSLPVEDRKLVVDVLRDMRSSGEESGSLALQQIWEIDYRWKPVAIGEFLDDEYYLGKFTETLFPAWRTALEEIFSPGSQVCELILGGSIGAGKTFTGNICLAYLIYRMSCLHNPQRYYGLAHKSRIVFGLYSVTKAQVSAVGYDKLRMFVQHSPYFEEKFPFNTKLEKSINFLNHPISVVLGSREIHALGADLFAIIMDEANFMQAVSQKAKKTDPQAKGQAEKIYNAVQTRIKSRYLRPGGVVPGMAILISSKQSEDAFLERRKKEAKEDIEAGKVRVYEYSQWAVRDPRMFTKPKFYVEVGDRLYPSRILTATTLKTAEEESRPGADVIEVPGEYRIEFGRDVEQALRDIAGIATYGLTPLIRERKRIHDCVTSQWAHPFSRPEVSISDQTEGRVEEFFEPRKMFQVSSSRYIPLIDPHMPRFAHIDIGLTGDSLGLCIGHIHGLQQQRRINPADGVPYTDMLPITYIDLVLRVVPPGRGEIDLGKVRAFIMMLRDSGLPITFVSADGTYGRDCCQMMRKAGFESKPISVDTSPDPYLALRQAIFDKRILYYHYDPFINELSNLERNLDTGKIDHPLKLPDGSPGSKDVSDAVAAVNFTLTENPEALREQVGPEIATHTGQKEQMRDIVLQRNTDMNWAKIAAARKNR